MEMERKTAALVLWMSRVWLVENRCASPCLWCLEKKDRSIGVVDVPYVVGGKPMRITMLVVPGEVPCLLSKGWLKEDGADFDTQAGLMKLTRSSVATPMYEDESGHYEVDLVGEGKDRGEGRTVALRSIAQNNSPATPSRVLVTC